MYAVIREMHFSYGHRLLDHSGKCRHAHGHNGKAEIELASEKLDERGMVVDFDEIKKRIQAWIDSDLDHRMILAKRDPLVAALKAQNEPVVELDGDPTSETIAKMIFDRAKSEKLPVVRVRFWETPSSCVTYSGD